MASYVDVTNTLNFSLSFKPTSAFPLDARSMFGSYAAALAAAASAQEAGSSDSIYYIGEQLTVVENDVVSTYLIQADHTLKPVGTETLGDDKTITLTDGVLSLKSFGVEYYAYHNADTIITEGAYTYPDNMPAVANGSYVKIDEVWYVCADDAWGVASENPHETSYYTKTTGWKDGLQPKVAIASDGISYELAWYEPSTTTVEGLSSIVSSVQSEVSNLRTTVNDLNSTVDTKISTAVAAEKERAEAAESGLAERVTAVENSVNTINGDSSTEGSIDYKIAQAFSALLNNPDETMNSLQELVEWVNNHPDPVELANTVSANSTAISELETLVGTIPEGAVSTDVISYIKELVEAEKTRATGIESGLDSRLSAAETTISGLGTASTHAAEDFATAAQGAKADSAVQSVTAGENGHILVDSADVKVYELPKASVTQLGGAKVDGSSITSNDEGVISVEAVDHTKVTGLDTQLANTKDSAVNESKTYVDENAVLTSDLTKSTDEVVTPSDTKVLTEKAIYELLEWKTEM